MATSIQQIQLVQRLITHGFWTARNDATREVLRTALLELLPIAAGEVPKAAPRIAWLSAAYGGENNLADSLHVGVNLLQNWDDDKALGTPAGRRLDALAEIYGLPKDESRVGPSKPRRGRPFGSVSRENPNPVSLLAKELGGWPALVEAVKRINPRIHPDTPISWVIKNKVPSAAVQNLVNALCLMNRLPKPDWGNLNPRLKRRD